jgi:hypothetical protein
MDAFYLILFVLFVQCLVYLLRFPSTSHQSGNKLLVSFFPVVLNYFCLCLPCTPTYHRFLLFTGTVEIYRYNFCNHRLLYQRSVGYIKRHIQWLFVIAVKQREVRKHSQEGTFSKYLFSNRCIRIKETEACQQTVLVLPGQTELL